jgi:uncharacterized damage-inducible protein DinB
MQPSPKRQFVNAYTQEHATTLRLLRAYPEDQAELRPHAMSKTAHELAWIFVAEQRLCEKALTTGFDWSKPGGLPEMPPSLAEVAAQFEQGRERLVALTDAKDEDLSGSVTFPTAPRTISEVPLMQFLWMMLCDQIHHRGQFSIYLRMAGGRVPSIYGPTADEPWT